MSSADDSAPRGFGPLTQLAWVVPDLDAALSAIEAIYRPTPWVRLPGIEFSGDTCTYRGEPADFAADIALAYRGDLQLELIRPIRGVSIYTEFLAAHPAGGLHHVCFDVVDLDATLAEVSARPGHDVVQSGSMADGGIRFAYLDVSAAGASYVELAQVDDGMRAFFDAIRQG
ncbi:VOC family protein [Nocardioides sp. R-C-SC26]|uniref:VOC family protein n=1 Tax=Nocardioides sp. R-C-SC26 TaxID=2870414 RepID=UPI001E42DA5F|nr:VOC family protein [Nocardioides sp. R-C-SC26]